MQKRGGKGILTVNRTEKTGDVVALMEVLPEDEIMLITHGGIVIRSSVDQVRVTGRNAQGVRLVSLDEGDVVTAVARVVSEDKGEGEGEEADEPLGVRAGRGVANRPRFAGSAGPACRQAPCRIDRPRSPIVDARAGALVQPRPARDTTVGTAPRRARMVESRRSQQVTI